MAPRMPGDMPDASGKVKGGDGARSPIHGGEAGRQTGSPDAIDKIDGIRRGSPEPDFPSQNSRVIGVEAGLHLGITPTKPGRGTHNRLHTGGY